MAIALTAMELEGLLSVDTATATRLLAVSSALVLKYAPTAPDPVHGEAVIRLAAWMKELPHGVIQRLDVGTVEMEFSMGTHSPLLRSGAAAILSPFKARRGGRIA